jgi:hypothetical protein
MGKLVSWIALGIFLIIVPLGSWYYLRLGLEYRRSSLAELLPKDSISVSEDSLQFFSNHTTVLSLSTADTDLAYMVSVQEQFKNSNGFRILFVDSVGGFTQIPSGYITNVLDRYKGSNFMLIDGNLKVRNVYNHDLESIKKMIEHIAMVIPRVKEADIKMKQ